MDKSKWYHEIPGWFWVRKNLAKATNDFWLACMMALLVGMWTWAWLITPARAAETSTFSCEAEGGKVYKCVAVEDPRLDACALEYERFDTFMRFYIMHDSWNNAEDVIKSAYSLRAMGCWVPYTRGK